MKSKTHICLKGDLQITLVNISFLISEYGSQAICALCWKFAEDYSKALNVCYIKSFIVFEVAVESQILKQ